MDIAATNSTPRPNQYDRFRSHVGAAFAQLHEASNDTVLSRYIAPNDVTDSIRTATIAANRLQKALDLGYQNSDDAGSFAFEAMESARAGAAALAPFAGIAFAPPHRPDGFDAAIQAAHVEFEAAKSLVLESLDAMYA